MIVQVFVFQRQLLVFSLGGTLADQPTINSPMFSPRGSETKSAGLDVLVPKPGSEIDLGMLEDWHLFIHFDFDIFSCKI